MRILVGTDEGLNVVRWIEGERAGRVVEKQFEGRQVYDLVVGERRLWAVVPDEGLFRSADRGETWERVVDRLDGRRIRSLAVTPRDGSRVLAGTEPAGLFLSGDDGATWRELEEFRVMGVRESWRDYGDRAAHVETITWDPQEPDRIYAGVEIGGAYRSDDGGASWNPINEGIFDDIHALAVDPWEPARALAATGGGFHVSVDRGLHWRRHGNEIGELYCTELELISRGTDVSSSLRSTLVLATADGPPSTWKGLRGNAKARLWLSRDSGESFVELSMAGVRDKGGITALDADPSHDGAGFFGTSSGNLYHGRLADRRWVRILFGLPAIRSVRAY
jgi:photosystem II stability/assembly factor-like uncharacterized protein